mmetsp:Transcript_19615/g.63703  ORF Transcript_19615/g.63703 Transcript_19615/m.63703 type:complete len:220 (+) Transcript_19615:1086-1745(+)
MASTKYSAAPAPRATLRKYSSTRPPTPRPCCFRRTPTASIVHPSPFVTTNASGGTAASLPLPSSTSVAPPNAPASQTPSNCDVSGGASVPSAAHFSALSHSSCNPPEALSHQGVPPSRSSVYSQAYSSPSSRSEGRLIVTPRTAPFFSSPAPSSVSSSHSAPRLRRLSARRERRISSISSSARLRLSLATSRSMYVPPFACFSARWRRRSRHRALCSSS